MLLKRSTSFFLFVSALLFNGHFFTPADPAQAYATEIQEQVSSSEVVSVDWYLQLQANQFLDDDLAQSKSAINPYLDFNNPNYLVRLSEYQANSLTKFKHQQSVQLLRKPDLTLFHFNQLSFSDENDSSLVYLLS